MHEGNNCRTQQVKMEVKLWYGFLTLCSNKEANLLILCKQCPTSIFELFEFTDDLQMSLSILFHFLFEVFTSGKVLTEEGLDFAMVEPAFLENFSKEERRHNVVGESIELLLHSSRLMTPMNQINTMYDQASFNEKVTFWFLQGAVTKILQLPTFRY